MQAEIADFGEKADLRQAITDVAMEYSLVTDYTSMLVLSEEQFAGRGVERRNRDRRQQAVAAQQQRAASQPQTTRVNNKKPMFNLHAPSLGGGGGSLDLWYGLLLAPLAALRMRGRNRK
jgi:Ca-activated chloride channel family protein